MLTGSDKTCDVRDVGEKDRTDFIGDLAEAFEVDLAGVGRSTADDDLRLRDLGDVENAVVVDTAVKLDTLGEAVVVFTREAHFRTVCQVTTVREVHTQDLVTRFEQGGIDGTVGL